MYQVRTGFACPDAAPFTVVISALAPLMLRAAGEVADGTVTWMVGKNTIAASTAPQDHGGSRQSRPRRTAGDRRVAGLRP